MTPAVLPQHVANDGIRAMHAAIADPERFACEPKVDGVRGLLVFDGDTIAMRDRRGERRDWLRGRATNPRPGINEEGAEATRTTSTSALTSPTS